jgi:hypothetical protein
MTRTQDVERKLEGMALSRSSALKGRSLMAINALATMSGTSDSPALVLAFSLAFHLESRGEFMLVPGVSLSRVAITSLAALRSVDCAQTKR